MKIQTFFPRKIYPALKEHLKSRHITVLTGMRRTGKTTLIKQLLTEVKSANKLFFDLQKLSDQDLFSQRNYDNVIVDLQKRGLKINEKIYLAIDEIQFMPEISGLIKYLYDHYDIKFLVTGSSSYYLKNLFNESLAGRKKIFELFPLDFGEFLNFKNTSYLKTDFIKQNFSLNEYERLSFLYEEYIEFGGFPEVVLLNTNQEKIDLLNDLISSYINTDIKSLIDFRQSADVYNLIKMLAKRVGTKLDYTKISSLTGISRTSVINYLDLFEKTYLIFRLPVYTKNIDREIVKAKKIYFTDSGFLKILAQIDSGSQFENTIFNQLRHHGELKYFSLKTGREIDFILSDKLALEVKETPTREDEKNLANLSSQAGLKKFRLIGRYSSPSFQDYFWGGEIK